MCFIKSTYRKKQAYVLLSTRVYLDPRFAESRAVANGFAAQSAADGSLFFARANERGLWRLPASGDAAARVTDSVSAGDWANWSVTSRGVFLVARSGHDIVLRHMPLDGGDFRQVAILENYSWPGFTITPDGSHVLYPRWDRRQSNLMAVEMGK
jgi:hypothetical protein